MPASTSSATLLAALEKRLSLVADRKFYESDPSGHLDALRTADDNLKSAIDSLPADIHPELRHYLERQSYVKAVAWLKERLVQDL